MQPKKRENEREKFDRERKKETKIMILQRRVFGREFERGF
jgi:hypothetical protein